ncbi:hypothetical protein DB346_15715 [Verrucomicrobia bacterium LW23]|nr:hypothetical protein DB346_15715 [Verrucomicrobia bacterium LW23]
MLGVRGCVAGMENAAALRGGAEGRRDVVGGRGRLEREREGLPVVPVAPVTPVAPVIPVVPVTPAAVAPAPVGPVAPVDLGAFHGLLVLGCGHHEVFAGVGHAFLKGQGGGAGGEGVGAGQGGDGGEIGFVVNGRLAPRGAGAQQQTAGDGQQDGQRLPHGACRPGSLLR